MASANIDQRFTSAIMKRLDAIIGDGDLGSLTKFNKIVGVLKENNLAYESTILPGELFVHDKNRSGTGVNPHNVHHNLAVIKTIGADRDHLKKATCLEIDFKSDQGRKVQQFNLKLVDQAEGLLAPATSKERYATLSCSHFTCGARAVLAGCRSSEKSLQDKTGHLNIHEVCANDEVLKDLFTSGWTWLVLPGYLEVLYPELPDLAQSSLNADHGTYSMANELQVMLSLSGQAAQHPGIKAWEEAIETVRRSMPPSHSYLTLLADFAREYGGGDDVPMIRFLDAFAKEFGANKTIGEHCCLDHPTCLANRESCGWHMPLTNQSGHRCVVPQGKAVHGPSNRGALQRNMGRAGGCSARRPVVGDGCL